MSSTKSEKTDSQSCILYDSSSMHSGKKSKTIKTVKKSLDVRGLQRRMTREGTGLLGQ